MAKVTCLICGSENEVDNFVIHLHKCPNCEEIKFDREFLSPIMN